MDRVSLAGRPRDQIVIETKGGLQPAPGGGIERHASRDWIRHGVAGQDAEGGPDARLPDGMGAVAMPCMSLWRRMAGVR